VGKRTTTADSDLDVIFLLNVPNPRVLHEDLNVASKIEDTISRCYADAILDINPKCVKAKFLPGSHPELGPIEIDIVLSFNMIRPRVGELIEESQQFQAVINILSLMTRKEASMSSAALCETQVRFYHSLPSKVIHLVRVAKLWLKCQGDKIGSVPGLKYAIELHALNIGRKIEYEVELEMFKRFLRSMGSLKYGRRLLIENLYGYCHEDIGEDLLETPRTLTLDGLNPANNVSHSFTQETCDQINAAAVSTLNIMSDIRLFESFKELFEQ